LPAAPKQATAGPVSGAARPLQTEWDAATHTCLVKFENRSEGVRVMLRF
jgi:hypothetical protein